MIKNDVFHDFSLLKFNNICFVLIWGEGSMCTGGKCALCCRQVGCSVRLRWLLCCLKPLSAYWSSVWGLCPLLEKERWCLPLLLQGSCCALQFRRCLSIFRSAEVSVATPDLFWSRLMWNLIVSPFTFSSFLSWHLKWVPYRHLVGSYFCFVLPFYPFCHSLSLGSLIHLHWK